MKWLKFLKAARKRTLEGGAEAGAADDGGSPHKHSKRRSMQQERKERTSIEQWHEARKSRTSIDICAAFNVTTTERLSVCKAGITLLINRTYIVIKHLGAGSSGQVKLAFNLRSKKLVAIKAVHKAGGGGHGLHAARDTRSYDGRSSRGSRGSHGGAGDGSGNLCHAHHHQHHHIQKHHHQHQRQEGGCLDGRQCVDAPAEAAPGGGDGSAAAASGKRSSGGGGGGSLSRGWRAIAPSSFLLRRSASSGMGSSTAAVSSTCRGGFQHPSSSPTSWPMRRCPGSAASAAAATEDFVREIAILKRLSHPNIVQLVEVIDDPGSDCLLLVMGYVEGATLQPQQLPAAEGGGPGRWRPVAEEVAWRHARDVLCGLEYLHCHGVVHGDLKPANFIQDSLTGVVRILDFGSAVLHGRVGGSEEGLRGAHVPMSCTPGFRSPESLVAGYRPSFELDMWALGVCLYMWLFGELPFKGSAPFVVYDNIRSAPLAIPTAPRISPQLHDMITRLLDKDPLRRMTVHEAVLHPWTTAQGLAPLRTPSPLVMATRVQLATAAAAAASGDGDDAAAAGNRPAHPGQQQQHPAQAEPWRAAAATARPPSPLSRSRRLMQVDDVACLDAAAEMATGSASLGAASSFLLQQQQSAATAPAGTAVLPVPPPPPPLMSCSSSSVNLLSTAAADAACSAAELLIDPARRGRTPPVVPVAPASAAAVREIAMMEPWTAAGAGGAALAAAESTAAPSPPEAPWRMCATASTAASPPWSLTGMTATSCPTVPPSLPRPASPALFTVWGMPRIAEGSSTGYAGSLGGMSVTACGGGGAAAAVTADSIGMAAGAAAAAAAAAAMAVGGSTGGRRKSGELWELRRSVTDEELQAAISSCCDPTGSAAVLMESIFAEVTFPTKQQIIRAGDPLDRIYLITAGEVEIYHDLMQDGPDAPCPHKPIIEGLSDPESELGDPGAFLNIRLPGSHVTQLERLSTGLLNFTATGGGGGGGGSNHGAFAAAAALAAAFGSAGGGAGAPSPGPSAPASTSGYTPAPPTAGAAGARAAGGIHATTLTGLGGGGGKGSGGREPSVGSIGPFSRAATQPGHLIVAVKGPGDSLGFAGMLPGSNGNVAAGESLSCDNAGSSSAAGAATSARWSANVRARTSVTAFVASIESLHKLARAHPQVEPLLQQMAVQQETDLAVAEAMRSLRLVGGAAAARGAAAAAAAAAAGSGGATAPDALAAGPSAAAAMGAASRARAAAGGGGGVSSEGESESCGTAATLTTDTTAASAACGAKFPRRGSSQVVVVPAAAAYGIGGAAAAAAAAAGIPFDLVESNGEVEGVEDVVMMSGELS